MFSYFSIYGLLLVSLIVRAAAFEAISFLAFDGKDGDSHWIGTRWPRSASGIAAVRAFMQGSREVASKSPTYRKYLKQGTEVDAVNDFNSLNTEIIKRQGYGALGVIGDTKIQLKLRDKKNSKLPTVQIWDPNMEKSVKILYVNKPILYKGPK